MPGEHETAQSLAETYAKGVLLAAQERGQADALAEEFDALIDYLQTDGPFAAFLTSAAIDGHRRRDTLGQIFGAGRLSELLLHLLWVLNDRGRLELLQAIAGAYHRELDVLRGRRQVRVTTAVPLSSWQKDQIQAAVSRYTTRHAVLEEHVQPDIIGGLILELDDQLIDGSIRRQLDDLAAQIRQRGTRELQGGRRFTERPLQA
jgi:F-type H+-transporting ATPase subunit delta